MKSRLFEARSDFVMKFVLIFLCIFTGGLNGKTLQKSTGNEDKSTGNDNFGDDYELAGQFINGYEDFYSRTTTEIYGYDGYDGAIYDLSSNSPEKTTSNDLLTEEPGKSEKSTVLPAKYVSCLPCNKIKCVSFLNKLCVHKF